MMVDEFIFSMNYGASWVFCISFIVLLVWLYSVLIERKDKKNDVRKSRPIYQTPLEILEQRFAQGKISKEEYEQRKEHLKRDVMP